MNYQTGAGKVVGAPKSAGSQAEVWVTWAPHLWQVSEVGILVGLNS